MVSRSLINKCNIQASERDEEGDNVHRHSIRPWIGSGWVNRKIPTTNVEPNSEKAASAMGQDVSIIPQKYIILALCEISPVVHISMSTAYLHIFRSFSSSSPLEAGGQWQYSRCHSQSQTVSGGTSHRGDAPMWHHLSLLPRDAFRWYTRDTYTRRRAYCCAWRRRCWRWKDRFDKRAYGSSRKPTIISCLI